MSAKRLLILGGTGEAIALARDLSHRSQVEVITSLAGQTKKPVLPQGSLRRGGFGGSDGLRDFLENEEIALVADATHPFAATISANAVSACAASGRPYLRLERPPWQAVEGDVWQRVASAEDAAAALPAGAKVMITVGRRERGPFFARRDISIIARMIEPPDVEVPENCEVLLARPPFSLEGEIELMHQRQIDHLVSKNSGGHATYAKIEAARALGLPVIMIERPEKAAAPTANTVEALLAMIEDAL